MGDMMLRQAEQYEKELFELVKEYNCRFYYEGIVKELKGDEYVIKVDKPKEEMVGRAYVIFDKGGKIDYEIKYNRIINLSESYTLIVPGIKAG